MSTILVVNIFVIWLLLLVLAVAVFALYRYFGQMYVNSPEGRARQGPEVGSSLLSIARQDVAGQGLTLPSARPALLLFADTACDLCAHLRDRLHALGGYVDRLDVVVFCSGQHGDVQAWATRAPAYARVVPDAQARAAHHYAVNGTPFVVSVGQGGTVRAKGIINDEDGLVRAAEEALSSQPTANGTQVGEVTHA